MTASPRLTIRIATRDDSATLLDLIQALADYEHLEGPSEAARARLVEHGFGERPKFEALLAYLDEQPAGYALFFETYSTFLCKPTLYLEDLFVLPEYRSRGVGRAFFRFLAQLARERDCGRIEWTVLDWNEPALRFYRKLGGSHLDEWLHYRLAEEQIARLADESDCD